MAIEISSENCSVNTFVQLKDELTKAGNTLVLQFSAPWCKPCRAIAPACRETFTSLPDNVYILEIDIDTALDLYSRFKRLRMLKGVPALFVWYPHAEQSADSSLASDDSCTSAAASEVECFLERVRARTSGGSDELPEAGK